MTTKATTTKRKTTRKKAAKPAAKTTAKPTYLSLVQEVRKRQLSEGNFDCFGRASQGFCDQGQCFYRQECLDISRKLDA